MAVKNVDFNIFLLYNLYNNHSCYDKMRKYWCQKACRRKI